MKYHISFDVDLPDEVAGQQVTLEHVQAWAEFQLGENGMLHNQPLSHKPLEAESNSVLVDWAY